MTESECGTGEFPVSLGSAGLVALVGVDGVRTEQVRKEFVIGDPCDLRG